MLGLWNVNIPTHRLQHTSLQAQSTVGPVVGMKDSAYSHRLVNSQNGSRLCLAKANEVMAVVATFPLHLIQVRVFSLPLY